MSSYTYNSSNQLTSKPGTSYTYDHNGNLLTKSDASGTTSYSWDYYTNRLNQVRLPAGAGTVTFRYDPFGRRIQKSGPLGTTNYLYDGANLLEEVDNSGNILARYTETRGLDEELSVLRSGTTSYFQTDGLGSATSLSNGAGSLAKTYTFDSYGKQTASTGTLTNQFQYTGREFDSETGPYFNRARYYDPSVGRFISEDPLAFESGPNYYSYVHNSPIRFIDPRGLVEIEYILNFTHYNFWYSLWNAGSVQPHYSWHGTCTKMCDDKWTLNLTLSVTLDINYSSDSNLSHELMHAAIAENFFDSHKPQFENFEQIFGSEAECKRYLQNQLNTNVQNQLQTDQPILDQQQSDYDWPWGWWND